MTDLRKAAEQALEALENIHPGNMTPMAEESWNKAAEALRQALNVDAVNRSQDRVDETAKGEHEPWPSVQCTCGGTIYFKHTKREWVGLTDAQVEEIAEYHGIDGLYETSRIDFYRAIEITLKEKNT